MPIPILAAAAAAQGAAAVAQPIVDIFQNKANRKFALNMYERQKNDALEMWNMQNAYNSPEQQMERFKAAGLNPNLIYGQGNSGNASPVNVPSQARYEGKSPRVADAGRGALNALLEYQNIRGQRLVNNNLGAQNDVLRADAELKRATAANMSIKTGLTSLDYSLRRQAKNSLLMELQSRGPIANARANLYTDQVRGQQLRNELSEQQYRMLENMNPLLIAKAGEIVKRLKEQGMLNEATLERRLKENNLVGFSGGSEIGSLVRALITLFNVNPSGVFK